MNKSGKKHPNEVKYFILDPAVENELENKRLVEIFHEKYGKEPTAIDIMFPVADIEHVFPQYYKCYGSSSLLKCKGDGETAETNSEEHIKALENIGKGDFGTKVKCRGRECPFYVNKQCKAVATLSVLLPRIPGSGVWQITTGSYHSIVNLNSCFKYITCMTGRFHMLPLKLERREQEMSHEGKKMKHYILHVNLELALSELQRMATIDPVKSAMELPPIEDDVIDLYTRENENINPVPADNVEPPKESLPAPEGKKDLSDAPTREQRELALNIEAAFFEIDTLEQLDEVVQNYTEAVVGKNNMLTSDQRKDLKALLRKRTQQLASKP